MLISDWNTRHQTRRDEQHLSWMRRNEIFQCNHQIPAFSVRGFQSLALRRNSSSQPLHMYDASPVVECGDTNPLTITCNDLFSRPRSLDVSLASGDADMTIDSLCPASCSIVPLYQLSNLHGTLKPPPHYSISKSFGILLFSIQALTPCANNSGSCRSHK